MPKLLMTIFTENSSLGVSMLCNLAKEQFGWEVDIFFVSPSEDSEKLKDHISNYKPDLLGISLKSFERSQAFKVSREVRESFPSLPMIAGGIHATLQPQDLIDENIFSGIVVGDGMGIMGEILSNYKNYKGEFIFGKSHSDVEFYCKFFHSNSQIKRMINTSTATVLSTIGCPFKCTFCHSGSDTFRVLPIELVADYVIKLFKDYGVQCFHFVDDLFAGNVKRLRKFRTIIEASFPDFTISSQVSGKPSTFTPEIAEELVKLGVETINFGVETASPKLLTFLNKKQKAEDCYRAVEICHEYGLNSVVNLMFGIPTQTDEDYEHTVNFVKNAHPDSITNFFYSPYPGTSLYNYCFENGHLSSKLNQQKFDWFDAEIDGISDIQIKLENIDYEKAKEYMKETEDIMNRDDYLFERLRLIDQQPWVFVGTTRHFYFTKILKKLSNKNWINCLGYINLDEDTGFQIDTEITLPKFDINSDTAPFLFATYAFLGADYKIINSNICKLSKKEIPLVSVSSFKKSHTPDEIKKMLPKQSIDLNLNL